MIAVTPDSITSLANRHQAFATALTQTQEHIQQQPASIGTIINDAKNRRVIALGLCEAGLWELMKAGISLPQSGMFEARVVKYKGEFYLYLSTIIKCPKKANSYVSDENGTLSWPLEQKFKIKGNRLEAVPAMWYEEARSLDTMLKKISPCEKATVEFIFSKNQPLPPPGQKA